LRAERAPGRPLHSSSSSVCSPRATLDAARRYSAGFVVAVKRANIIGRPDQISTSYVERQNLTMRMNSRRLTRLTDGFSKKLDHHVAAIGLYVAH
jgi:IS1 family transposase